MPTSIQHFRGVQDNLEDPDKYIEDLEWAYAQNYQSTEPSHNLDAKQICMNKTYRILIHNNFEGKAVDSSATESACSMEWSLWLSKQSPWWSNQISTLLERPP